MEEISEHRIDKWETLMFTYESALKEIATKIDILNNEFIKIHNYNPIEHVTSRIKSSESIVKKLKRHGLEVAQQKPHPHGHGWSLANNVDRWTWA